jgi:3-oxoacyl-[acyl-carrier protein] reductase
VSPVLDGQVALVTGASRGIGRSIAECLGRRGARVVGTATTDAGADRIAADFSAAGIDGKATVLDVSDPASVGRLGKFMETSGIAPSILVNNAGIARDNLLLRMSEQEWNDVVATNLGSVYRMSRLCLRAMLKARYGRIISLTSVVALSGNAGQANYAAAKAGIIGFTRSLAREVGSRGITVNAVAPGFITTDMTDAIAAEQKEQLVAQISLGRLGTPQEVAEVVAFLASPSAAYITGEVINVNGGMYMA